MFDVLDRDEPTEPPTTAMGPTVVDALVEADPTAALLATMTPVADVVVPLSVLDPDGLCDAGQVDALAAVERQPQ